MTGPFGTSESTELSRVRSGDRYDFGRWIIRLHSPSFACARSKVVGSLVGWREDHSTNGRILFINSALTGGCGGIRTHETLAGLPVFKTGKSWLFLGTF
jgi:hypothetical protein